MNTELDFRGIRWNIEDIPEHEDVIDRFPDLATMADVFMDDTDCPDDVSCDKVLRFLILMYSPKSPISEIPDIKRRKQYVLDKLNLIKDDDVSDGYKQMCELQEPWIVRRFLSFVRLFTQVHYRRLAIAEQRLYKMERFMLNNEIDKANDDSNLSKGVKLWYDDMEDCMDKILQGENSQLAREALQFSIVQQNLGLSPEDAVDMFLKGTYPKIENL